MDIFGGILGFLIIIGIVATVIFIRVHITSKAEQARAGREQAAAAQQLGHAPSATSVRESYGPDDAPPPPPPGW